MALPYTFNELGGDSIGASLFSMSIENIFEVSLPANVILSPTGNIDEWATFIEEAQNPALQQVTFANIHGKETTTIKASHLQNRILNRCEWIFRTYPLYRLDGKGRYA